MYESPCCHAFLKVGFQASSGLQIRVQQHCAANMNLRSGNNPHGCVYWDMHECLQVMNVVVKAYCVGVDSGLRGHVLCVSLLQSTSMLGMEPKDEQV
jgi:hypothetical protein